MRRPSWNETWLEVARVVGQRSRCVRDQVGAVIVDVNNRIVATGYNGPPAGYKYAGYSDNTCAATVGNGPMCLRTVEEPTEGHDNCIAVHAEANALMFCDRRDREGGTIYIKSVPCFTCAKLIANSGLHRVVVADPLTLHKHRDPDKSLGFLRDNKIMVMLGDEVDRR